MGRTGHEIGFNDLFNDIGKRGYFVWTSCCGMRGQAHDIIYLVLYMSMTHDQCPNIPML